ncbi:hypothetical protein RG963_04850 [Methanosarcina sp. Z-7115]|uniref:Uncharacterized protein n=1 Tax=Methanosarcina baikalica TaxID=3073890 RepID=A0ABU2CZG9_9EURY|nr:hypothetical protein [Methanosarcina sp. Z-7115]MDR7665125.1 hypothetical protein [Methanosarcina sp. Z-7115]
MEPIIHIERVVPVEPLDPMLQVKLVHRLEQVKINGTRDRKL